jgi:hypothetical protein
MVSIFVLACRSRGVFCLLVSRAGMLSGKWFFAPFGLSPQYWGWPDGAGVDVSPSNGLRVEYCSPVVLSIAVPKER